MAVAAGVELVADGGDAAVAAEALAGRDQQQGAGEDAGALGEGEAAVLDREQQAEGEGEDRPDRREARAPGVAGDLATDRGGRARRR